MTRIGIFSDSHGDKQALDVLLDKMGPIDACCFLGDIASDAMYLCGRVSLLPGRVPFYAVKGNNDYSSSLPLARVEEIGGRRIYMTHGHLCSSVLSLAYTALENGADAALFGHTHQPFCEQVQGVLLVNPGSAGNHCRGGSARACVMSIDRGVMRVDGVEMYD